MLLNDYKGIPDAASLVDFLKRVLHDCQVEFTVAPFSALAQVSSSRQLCIT